MATVRAKFVCTDILYSDEEGKEVVLQAVTSGSAENDTFFKYTPYGELKMGVVNPSVEFEKGKEYYIDFTPAE